MPIKFRDDPLWKPAIRIQARELLGAICRLGGAVCPLISAKKAKSLHDKVKSDPTVTIQLISNADAIPHYTQREPSQVDPKDVLNRKRDLDVLQRLGLVPGDIRRARYLFELLFQRIATPYGICAFDTTGWEGCAQARSGAYESVRAKGWKAVVYCRSDQEREEYRRASVERIEKNDRIYIRAHHLLCMSCWYAGGEGKSPRPNDTLAEILSRIQRDPDVLLTLVEGNCEACYCCDGFHPPTGRCVHAGGLIRDYKKDLDVFQKLGLMPGATLKARDAFDLLFARIPSTRDICGYGDGVVRSEEWRICGGPEGNPGYLKTRQRGIFSTKIKGTHK